MQFDPQVFKPNDIRGTYPDQLSDAFAHLLGRALAQRLGAARVALGMDSRISSPPLCGALAQGARSAGAEVASLGVCPIEHVYYLMGARDEFDLAVMVTASHNPPHFNGFKVVARGAEPVSERDGLDEVRRWMAGAEDDGPQDTRPPEPSLDVAGDCLHHALSAAGVPDAAGLKVVVDPGNGVGGLLWEGLGDALGLAPVRMNFAPDGSFPAHEPNPARMENLLPLRARVAQEGADLGIAYDGDADRAVAVLADGHVMDGTEMIAALIERLFRADATARCALSMVVGRKVLDFVRARGSEPLMVPVGHAKVKRIMRADSGIAFAGEQSGHYFYREFFCCESSLITTLHLLHLASADRLRPLASELPGPWHAPAEEPGFAFEREEDSLAACRRAALAGLEIFPDPVEIMCERNWQITRHCTPADIAEADGIRVDYADWWFCARPSATEPMARLTGEARTEGDIQAKLGLLSEVFRR